MLLDVFEISGVLESWVVPIQMSEPFVEMRIAGANISNVTFEVLHVNRVEANDSGEQAYICFRNVG